MRRGVFPLSRASPGQPIPLRETNGHRDNACILACDGGFRQNVNEIVTPDGSTIWAETTGLSRASSTTPAARVPANAERATITMAMPNTYLILSPTPRKCARLMLFTTCTVRQPAEGCTRAAAMRLAAEAHPTENRRIISTFPPHRCLRRKIKLLTPPHERCIHKLSVTERGVHAASCLARPTLWNGSADLHGLY